MNKIDQSGVLTAIKSFIRYNEVKERVSIDFDGMCILLLNQYRRFFNVALFERELTKELKKVEGKPVSPEFFDEIARYVNDMTIHMHQKSGEAAIKRQEDMQKRFNKYAEDLARYKTSQKENDNRK